MSIIEAKHICKSYKLYRSPFERLKESLSYSRQSYHKTVHALKDIDISIDRGETVGLIGMNGSGKSTLLQIIAGVLSPTSGDIKVRGKVSALLELGAGFNSDFSGLENVKFQCSLMEIHPHEQKEVIERIRAFAEIGDFVFHPVKTYSSGMFVRLAFATAICLDPDILIVDEALAVGDVRFQNKCYRKIRAFIDSGKTLLFVSHDANAVKTLCDRAYLLHRGSVLTEGKPDFVIKYYNNLLALEEGKEPEAEIAERSGNGKIRIRKVRLLNSCDTPTSSFFVGENVKVLVEIEAFEDVKSPTVGISLHNRLGIELYGINNHNLGFEIGDVKKGDRKTIIYNIKLNLGLDTYSVSASCHPEDTHLIENYDWVNDAFSFKIISHPNYKFVGACLLSTEVSVEDRWQC